MPITRGQVNKLVEGIDARGGGDRIYRLKSELQQAGANEREIIAIIKDIENYPAWSAGSIAKQPVPTIIRKQPVRRRAVKKSRKRG